MSEVYYVMKGKGEATIGGDTAQTGEGDAVPAAIDESRAFRKTPASPRIFPPGRLRSRPTI